MGYLTGNAAAADDPEHKSKSARKLLATLNSIGINNQDVKNLVTQADSSIDDNYLYLTERKVGSGQLALRMELSTSEDPNKVHSGKRLQLHYQPKNSHLEITAHTNSVMFNYHLQLQ